MTKARVRVLSNKQFLILIRFKIPSKKFIMALTNKLSFDHSRNNKLALIIKDSI